MSSAKRRASQTSNGARRESIRDIEESQRRRGIDRGVHHDTMKRQARNLESTRPNSPEEKVGVRTRTIVERPLNPTMVSYQKRREEDHRKVKSDAMRLWARLDNPVYDSPINPEEGFSEEAILVAKRGRRCTMETHFLGSIQTKKRVRDYERSAKFYGNDEEQLKRLEEYPRALKSYQGIVRRLRQRCGTSPSVCRRQR